MAAVTLRVEDKKLVKNIVNKLFKNTSSVLFGWNKGDFT